jgi:energy-coupling factor transport system permease protein
MNFHRHLRFDLTCSIKAINEEGMQNSSVTVRKHHLKLGTTIVAGRYLEGTSLLHRVSPGAKLFVLAIYLVVLLSIHTPVVLMLFAAGLLLVITLTGVPFGFTLQGVRPLMKLAFVAFVINAFFAGGTAFADSGILQYVSREGSTRSLTMFVRLLVMTWITALLTATTPPLVLAHSIAHLLSPLEKIKVPVADISRILSLSIVLIPVVAEKAETFMTVRTPAANLSKKARLDRLLKEITVLFEELFMHGRVLATELDTGYQQQEEMKAGKAATGFGRNELLFMMIAFGCLALLVFAEHLFVANL